MINTIFEKKFSQLITFSIKINTWFHLQLVN